MEFEFCSHYDKGNIEILSSIEKMHCNEISQHESVIFDLTKFNEVTPFNSLVLAIAIKQFIEINQDKDVRYSVRFPSNSDGFLSHLGFYDLIGAQHGKKIGEAKPNHNYLPIRKIDFRHDFYDTIELEANNLAKLFEFDSDMSNFIAYTFTELIRNTYEHAKSNDTYVCAQKWQTKNEIEIAVVDAGRGIASAMQEIYKNRSEKELINLALMPGISIKSNHAYLERNNWWRNSGYGLYALKKLTQYYSGYFILCSGGMAYCQNEECIKYYKTNFKGTALCVRLKTNTNNKFKKTLSSIMIEGKQEAKSIPNAIKIPSKSSGGKYIL